MISRAAISLLALPLLLAGGGHRYGMVNASDALRLRGAPPTFTLSAGDATARQAPALRGRRNPKVSVPKPRAVPAPGPLAGPRPNSVGGHTTIAPFPVPGDTSRGTAERMKTLNVPKPGMTTIAPLPPPTSQPTPMPTPATPTPTPAPDQDPPRLGPDGRPLPAFGEYVYVEELPEAIVRVPPTYPRDALAARVEGLVMVQALVLRDGTVADVRIVKSIPPLDAAAAAAVRQWRFKPAMANGQPVAVWVGVPVKFTIH